MVVAEILTGIALVQKSVSFIKENISTVKDISGIAKEIDGFFTGVDQMNKKQGKGLSIMEQFGSVENSADDFINRKYLRIKLFLVSTLIVVAVISVPLISLPGNKFLKHALEWDYFLGVIVFYLLTFLDQLL